MPEIPEQLQWYTPLEHWHGGTYSSWQMRVDQNNGCFEIKRAPLFICPSTIVVLFFIAVTLTICLAIDPFSLAEETRMVCVGGAFLFWCFVLLVYVVDTFFKVSNARYWKGALRFRYDPASGELFFGKEKDTYRSEDYTKLVLGCVRGAYKNIDSEIVRITQVCMLLLDKNDEWRRYTLSDEHVHWLTPESGSVQFVKLVEQLQPLLAFDLFVRDYSREECYEQHRRSTG